MTCAPSKDVKPDIEPPVQVLHTKFTVKLIVVCQTISRASRPLDTPFYSDCLAFLNTYRSVVLETVPFAEFWCHKGFRNPNIPVLCRDGVQLGKNG